MKKSAYREWFKAQYGGRLPNVEKRRRLERKIHELESVAHHYKQEVLLLRWLEDIYDAALKSWNAKETTK